MDVDALKGYTGRTVCVRLADGSEREGVLRTELLGDRSISVFLSGPGGGTTIYIDQITDVSPV